MKKTKVLCGCYIRVSTDEQAQVVEGSLKNQAERLAKYIAEQNKVSQNEEWIKVKEYIDKGISAKDTNRPQYQEMLKDVAAGKINMVLFWDISRLSRNTRNFLEFADHIEKYKADFRSYANRGLDTTGAFGKALLTLLATLMEFERTMGSVRSKEHRMDRANRGLKNGGHVFGYDLYPEPEKHGHLKVNERESKIVQFIFDEFLKTKSVHEVTKQCNRLGYKTKTFLSRRKHEHKGGNFRYTTVKQMLTNMVYIGVNEIHKANKGLTDIEEKDQYRTVKTDKWEPIIDEQTFNEAQRLFRQNKVSRKKFARYGTQYDFLLSDLVHCHHCNSKSGNSVPLTHSGTVSKGKYIPYYIHRKETTEEGCPIPPALNAQRLEKVVWNRLVNESERKFDDVLLKNAMEETEGAVPKKITTLQDEIVHIKERVKAVKEEHDKILAMGNAGGRVADCLKGLSDDINALKDNLAAKQDELKELESKNSAQNKAVKILKNKKKSLSNLPPEQKIQLIRDLVTQIRLQPDSIVIELHKKQPIVGMLKEATMYNGDKLYNVMWRRMDVEWLN